MHGENEHKDCQLVPVMCMSSVIPPAQIGCPTAIMNTVCMSIQAGHCTPTLRLSRILPDLNTTSQHRNKSGMRSTLLSCSYTASHHDSHSLTLTVDSDPTTIIGASNGDWFHDRQYALLLLASNSSCTHDEDRQMV